MPGTPPFRPGSDLVAIFNSHAILDAWLRFSDWHNVSSGTAKGPHMPFIVTGFRSEAEANGWIKIQSLRTKEAEPG